MLSTVKSMSVPQLKDVKLQPCSQHLPAPRGVYAGDGWKLPATGLPDLTKLKPTPYSCRVAVCNHNMSETDTLTHSIRFPPRGPPKCITSVLVSSLGAQQYLPSLWNVCLVFPNTKHNLACKETQNPQKFHSAWISLLALTPLPQGHNQKLVQRNRLCECA